MRGKAKMLLLPFNLVWLALILASLFDKNVAYNEDRLMATIHQNLIYALFPGDEFPQTRYTFNAANGFTHWRYNQLVDIAEKDNTTGKPRGSTQSNDAFMYDEWIFLQQNKRIYLQSEWVYRKNDATYIQDEWIRNNVNVGGISDAVSRLINKVEIFTSNNSNLYSCDSTTAENDLKEYDEAQKEIRIRTSLRISPAMPKEEKKKRLSRRKKFLSKFCQCFTPSSTSPPHTSHHDTSTHHEPSTSHPETSTPSRKNHCEELIELIIRCKVFIRDLHSEGGEGSLIDIFSFMNNLEGLGDLKQILNLSTVQSRELDKAINERIYQEHLENKMRKGYKNAIVQGAGPVVLLREKLGLINDRFEKRSECNSSK
uniref:Uncharacterized protein n=1 Tax=Meloidogyne floridensis TaxID=298350 RepID=A0A915P576_9BILA